MKKRLKFILFVYLIINIFNFSFANENFFNKGLELYNEKKYEDARFMFERSIVFNPKDSNSYLYLAKIYSASLNVNILRFHCTFFTIMDYIDSCCLI